MMSGPFCAEKSDTRRGVAEDVAAFDSNVRANCCDETLSSEDLQESGLAG